MTPKNNLSNLSVYVETVFQFYGIFIGIPVELRKIFPMAIPIIWLLNLEKISMTDWNSTIEHQLRPDELIAELSIGKQTYYNYLKHLGIKAGKDSKGKAYLSQEQAKLIRDLRTHVVEGGKIEDFIVSDKATALAVADASELNSVAEPVDQADPTDGLDLKVLHREASKLAAKRMTAGHHLVLAMAEQMTYEDLHPEAQAEVDQVRTAGLPKFNPQELATDLLSQFRQQMQTA